MSTHMFSLRRDSVVIMCFYHIFTNIMKVLRFNSVVEVITVPMHDECRYNEWIRRKVEFNHRVFKLQNLLDRAHQLHIECVRNSVDLNEFLTKLKFIKQEEDCESNVSSSSSEDENENSFDTSSETEDPDFEIVFELVL